MDTKFILIGVFIFLFLGFLVLFIISNIKKESFVADDGSSFSSQSDLELYQDLLLKTTPLFDSENLISNSKTVLGYEKKFLANLKTDGFGDLKTLLKYRDQFKTLSDLINP
mgnify:CR=1 FL=1